MPIPESFILWEGPDYEHLELTGSADNLPDAISLALDAPEGLIAQVDELKAGKLVPRCQVDSLLRIPRLSL